jgi:hypothetical protein
VTARQAIIFATPGLALSPQWATLLWSDIAAVGQLWHKTTQVLNERV